MAGLSPNIKVADTGLTHSFGGTVDTMNAPAPQVEATAQGGTPSVDPAVGQPTSYWARIAQFGAQKVAQLVLAARMQAAVTTKNPDAFRQANAENNANNASIEANKAEIAKSTPGPIRAVASYGKDVLRSQVAQPIADLTEPLQSSAGNGKNASQIAKLQDNAQKLVDQGKVSKQTLAMMKDAPASARIKALQMLGSSKEADVQSFLVAQTKGERQIETKRTGAALNLATLAEGGGEAKAAKGAAEATVEKGINLVRAAKTGTKVAALSGVQSAASQLESKQKVSAKDTAVDTALGFGAGAAGSTFLQLAKKTAGAIRLAMNPAEKARLAAQKMADERGLPAGTTPKALPSGSATKALPEGKPVEAPTVKGGEGISTKAVNNEKLAQLHIQHQQAVHRLEGEFNQVTRDISKSDHVVTKAPVESYTSTRQLQKDLAEELKQHDSGGVEMVQGKDSKLRQSTHSAFYKQTFKAKGRAPTNAEWQDEALRQLKSGKAPNGASEIYQKLKTQALQETDARYTQRLTDMNTAHETAVKEASTPREHGFTIPEKQTPEQSKVTKRVSQLDQLISEAQKNGTTKSAGEMRALMRERNSLLDTTKETPVKVTASTGTKAAEEKLIATQPKPERAPSNESGSVNPGAMAEDIQKTKAALDAHIAQDKKATKFSGDIARDYQIHEAVSKQRTGSSARLLDSLPNLSKEDKQAVFDYREAKAAGQPLPTLTEHQQALHDVVSGFVKTTNENKAELARLKVPGYDQTFDHEAGNHRIALGKGTAIERFLGKNQRTPLSARSLRTSTSSSKARIFHSITDESGNRSVATIQNVSVKQGFRNVSKGKYVTAISEDGTHTRLGKITNQQVKDGVFTAKNGKTYKIGDATANEITKASGQKYLKDPLTSAILDYHETANALDSARMIDKWKSSPDFENVAMKFGEGTPPKNWKSTTLPQMQGYSFEPKVAEVLDDIHGNIKNKSVAVQLINHALRNMMVAVPIRHNLNEIGFYFTDRGLSSLINPMAYKRGAAALIKATNEVMNQGDLYKQVVGKGFNFMYQDDHKFADAVRNQTKSMIDDPQMAERMASDIGTTVTKFRQAWDAVQHKGVWFQQDTLNMARIIERMDKGMSLDQAVAQTERFNPQYRVPSRVLNSRSASQLLRSNSALFFGSYHYDQWKTVANMALDLAGKNGGKAALEAADKFAALSLGVYVTHALVDKGLQQFSGNRSASVKPFGVMDFADQLYQLAAGKKTFGDVLRSQFFPASAMNIALQMFNNRDFFTGKNIYDTNLPGDQQRGQIKDWLLSQMGNPVSQFQKGDNAAGVGGGLATVLFGASFPKNTPETNKLYSMKFDTLPTIQSQAKKQAQAGDMIGAQKTITQYDKLLIAAAKAALKSEGKPVPSDNELIYKLKKTQYYYDPKPQTVKKWSTERPKSIVQSL